MSAARGGPPRALSLPPLKAPPLGRVCVVVGGGSAGRAVKDARGGGGTMQWRSLLLGLLLLRLGLQALLALLPALAPGLCLRRRPPFPFPFPPRAPAPGRALWVPAALPGGGEGAAGGGEDEYEARYGRAFPPQLRARLRDAARRMFAFGYDSYMRHAFPSDELDPLHCCGRGPDRDDP